MEKKVIRKYIWIFIALCIPISNVLWYISRSMFAEDSENGIALALMTLTSYLPAIVTLAMTKVTGEGWNNLGIQPKLKKSWKMYIWAIILTLIMIYLNDPIMLLAFRGNISYSAEGCSIQGWLKVLALAPLGLVGSIEMLGEELGWMGYLFPKLEKLHGTNRAILFISLIRTSWHIGIFFVLDHPLIGVCDLFISNLLSQALIVYLTKKSGSILPAATTHAITLFEPMFLTYSDEFYNANIIPMNLVGQISTLIVGGFCYYLMFKENLIKKKE